MSAAKHGFVIFDIRNQMYVIGFNSMHQVVQLTNNTDTAKKYVSESSANSWAVAHSNCGYGLSDQYEIREVKKKL
jgi:hypothetical protein